MPATDPKVQPTAHEALDVIERQVAAVRKANSEAIEARDADAARTATLGDEARAVRIAAVRSGDDSATALAAIDAELAQIAERKVERALAAAAMKQAIVQLDD